jgi:hypothetical protein
MCDGEAHRMGRRQVLLVKLGTTVAGGYVDAAGGIDYLTELGRCVIRADSEAPRHPFLSIQGFASRLIGTEALYEADAGRDYCKLLMESNGTGTGDRGADGAQPCRPAGRGFTAPSSD